MAVYLDGTTIWLYKGDTGNITFSGLPKDKNYTVYLSIFDEEDEKIISEIQANSFSQDTGTALVLITEEISNNLTVGEFTYALKICALKQEDTVIPQVKLVNNNYQEQIAPMFIVKPKRVEGA